MALSNWDTLAVDLTGEPVDGIFVSPLEIEVHVYKNWLYVYDPAAWREGGSYDKPVVAEIQEGRLTYQDVRISARRGPQQGIYAVVWNHTYLKEENRSIDTGMVACGVYGYEEDEGDDERWLKEGPKFVGVKPTSVEWLKAELNRQEHVVSQAGISEYMDGKFVSRRLEPIEFNAYTWSDVPNQARALDFSRAIRFNQGDGYFVRIGAVPALPATAPGEPEKTIFSQILDELEKSE